MDIEKASERPVERSPSEEAKLRRHLPHGDRTLTPTRRVTQQGVSHGCLVLFVLILASFLSLCFVIYRLQKFVYFVYEPFYGRLLTLTALLAVITAFQEISIIEVYRRKVASYFNLIARSEKAREKKVNLVHFHSL